MVVKRAKVDETGDSDDLQALFDNIAAGKDASAAAPPAPPAPPPPASTNPADDSDELQTLFDTEANKFAAVAADGMPKSAETGETGCDEAVFHRIGRMTRKLHDTLIELGLDGALQEVADTIPDARQRLTYVAQMTEQAASRVLNATDIARPAVDKMEAEANALRARWDKVFANQLAAAEFKTLAEETRTFLGATVENSRALGAQLLEIMMAQDFQ
ncbi:MAG: protein phosphatase CheZ, partial [Azoarcus sp.]|nr:protein phosphatase CheZ [Azoarcus sp.]